MLAAMSTSSNLPDWNRRQLERAWFDKVKDAAAVYRRAAEQHRQFASECSGDLSWRIDGSYLIARARRAESTALAQYRRVLRIYTDLLIKRRAPASLDDRQSECD